MTFDPLVDAEALFASVAAEVMAPPPPPDFSAWAVEHVRFGNESPFPGPYDPNRFPFFRRILEVLSPEHPARFVSLRKSAQIGGSVLCQIFVGATLDVDPCQVLYYHPTEGNAKEWARLKWKPMLRGSTRLQGLMGEERSRDGGQSILFYERSDGRGSVTVAGSNSGAAVSMKSARVQVQDDLAKWEILPSGDSESQADSRSKAFLFAKIFKNSTPLLEHSCRITKAWKAGTQERFHVPCPHCDVEQALEWENFAASIDEADADDAHFTCVACGAAIEQHHRAAMVARGRWVADNPGAADVSFYVWAAYAGLEGWGDIARAWLRAKGNPSAEQVFFNDTVGRAFVTAGESPEWEKIRDRARAGGQRPGLIPWGGLLFVAGADVQKNRIEVHLKTFGRDGRRWTIEYRVVEGEISDEATRTKLDALLTETWPDEHGNKRPIDMLAIDGNYQTAEVLGWARKHPWGRVIVVRGAKSEIAPPLVPVQSERKPDGKPRKLQRRFFNVGVSGLKGVLYTALHKTDPLARGYCGYPEGLEDEFYRQLCSERREPRKSRTGYVEYVWTKDPTQRNEVLDTEIYAEAAAIRLNWRGLTDQAFDVLEASLVERGRVARTGSQPDLFEPSAAPVRQAVSQAPAAPAPEAPRATRRVVRTSYMN